nr:uncharacterized protein LOC103414494 [Malus domestica]XP_028947725.1 uncharacterized protein LOC103414494 [Malus domestica]XP_028947726.1 uncharacterized protein LOC103414494 [Malus domestica]XP_028947727.1 uncharacterized protein LOC103414494 [Malus domestica]
MILIQRWTLRHGCLSRTSRSLILRALSEPFSHFTLMAAELQPPEAPITAGPTIPATTTTQLINTETSLTAITAIATTTAVHAAENHGQLGPKRQRRPSVRLGEIGDQPAATGAFESHMRRARPGWRLPKDSKSVKARSIINLVNGNESNEMTPPDERNQNGDGGFEFGSRRVKAKRATGTKRIRSNWASNSKLDDGDSREEGGEWFSADPDQDSPVRGSTPVNSGDDAGEDMWDGQRRMAGNWARASVSRENDAVEADNMPESNWSGVRSWLIELGLSRYTPVFEIHEVDDEVLPMLTLEDLKDMGINAVGSRRKMYAAIQKLRKGFS